MSKLNITLLCVLLFFCLPNVYAQDSDADGVVDAIDLDDDNDGILDIYEISNTCGNYAFATFSAIIAEPFSVSGSYASNNVYTAQSNSFTMTGTIGNHRGPTTRTNIFNSIADAEAWSVLNASQQANYANSNVSTIGGRNNFINNTQVIQRSVHGNSTGGVEPDEVVVTFATPLEKPLHFHIVESIRRYEFTNLTQGIANPLVYHVNTYDNNGTQEPTGTGVGTNIFTPVSRPNIHYDGMLTVEIPAGTRQFKWSSANISSMAGSPDLYIIAVSNACPVNDIDNDGIPNNLDLDSDNDGCPDYLEGGANLVSSNIAHHLLSDGNGGQVTTNLPLPVGNTPSNLGVPTIAGNGQSVGNSQHSSINNCTDSDGDGVPDLTDLDDDNDGILDIVESGGACANNTFASFSSVVAEPFSASGVYTSTLPNTAQSVNFTIAGTVNNDLNHASYQTKNFNRIVDGQVWNALNATQRATFAVTDVATVGSRTNFLNNAPIIQRGIKSGSNGTVPDEVTITFSAPLHKPIHLHIIQSARAYEFVSLTQGVSNPMVYHINTYNNGGTQSPTGSGIGTNIFTPVERTSIHIDGVFTVEIPIGTREFQWKSTNIATRTGNADVYDFAFSNACPSNDFDNDGIPNHLDLDSDNDGCPDMKEGGGGTINFSPAGSLLSDGNGNRVTTNLPLPVGTSGATLGVPIIVGSGQTGGSSQDTSTALCDSDGDLAQDSNDLDDDNDGIKDSEECDSSARSFTWSGVPTSNQTGQTITGTISNIIVTRTDNSSISSPQVWGGGAPYNSGQGNAGFNQIGSNLLNSTNYLLAKDSNNTTHQYTFSAPLSEPLYLFLSGLDAGTVINFTNTAIIKVHNGSSVGSSVLTVNSVGGGNISGATLFIPPGTSSFSYTVSSTSTEEYIVALSNICGDSDNDNIINSLDSDSDNDGCFDAIEGSGPFSPLNLDATNGALVGGVNTTSGSLNFGVPLIAGSGQGIGSSENATVQSSNCGMKLPVITQTYRNGVNESAIEITNFGNSNIPVNQLKIVSFASMQDVLTTNSSLKKTYSLTGSEILTPGSSILVTSVASLPNVTTNGTPVLRQENNITNFSSNSVIVLTTSVDSNAWANRYDVSTNNKDKTSHVRSDYVTGPSVKFKESEWVSFVDDNLPVFGDNTSVLVDPITQRHKFDALLSEVQSPNSQSNNGLGLHRMGATHYTSGSWSNGYPDRSRHIFVDDDYKHSNSSLSARRLSVTGSSNLRIDNQLLKVTDTTHIALTAQLRLLGDSQFIQTHLGASRVLGQGNLLIDQHSNINTTESVYRYNYWSSPVVEAGGTTYRVGNVMKDGTTPLSDNSPIVNINFSNSIYNGSPSSGGVTPITIADYWIWSFFDKTNRNDWEHKRSTGAIERGKGYTMKGTGFTGSAGQNYTFVGVPNDGEINLAVNANTTSLVGNPYPGSLDALTFIKENENTLTGELYFWEHTGATNLGGVIEQHGTYSYEGGYSMRNLAMGIAANNLTLNTNLQNAGQTIGTSSTGTYHVPSRYIAKAQGFFVSTNTSGGTIKFTNKQRAIDQIGSPPYFYKTKDKKDSEEGSLPILKLGFEYFNKNNLGIHRQLGISFSREHSSGYDYGYDSEMYDVNKTDVYFEFPDIEKKLIVTGVEEINSELEVPVVVNIDTDRSVFMMVDSKESIEDDVLLLDKVDDVYYNLSEPVELSLAKGIYKDRFYITFKKNSLGVYGYEEHELLTTIFADNTNKELVINTSNSSRVKKVELFSLLGKRVKTWNVDANKGHKKPAYRLNGLSSSVYVARVTLNTGVVSKKVLIHK